MGLVFEDEKTNTAGRPVQIHLLLDRSGSMESIREATVAAINTFVEKQQQNIVPTYFSLTLFDELRGELALETAIERQPVKSVKRIKDFNPRGNTPLYDAIVSTVDSFEGKTGNFDRVLFVIMTDGKENASKIHQRAEALDRINQKSRIGWEFVYLGANQDSFSVGQSIGIAPGNIQNYQATARGVARTMGATGMSASAFACATEYKSGTFFDQSNAESGKT